MSASPSGLSNGQTPTPTPNGGPPQFIRKPRAADPLRPRKKPVRRPNLPPGASVPKSKDPVPVASHVGRYPVNGIAPRPQAAANGANAPKTYGGWTNPPAGPVQDFPLYTTKRALREGLSYHIARFASKKDIDPNNQDEFTRPVVLHRRDPKLLPGRAGKEDEMQIDDQMDSKEREKLEILKQEKEARKAADLAQIAPTGNNPSTAAKRNQPFNKEKTARHWRIDENEEDKKSSTLKYEENLQWHLEDAENKNVWVGNYEAALSDTNVIFVIDGARFLMVPIEKWYKFTPKGQFKAFTIEEAEARMSKKTKESRWVMKENEKKEAQLKAPPMHKMYTVKSESSTFKNANKSEKQDMDDLDFDSDDLFQDDDEQATVEPDKDEDVKDAQEKIKREQLSANVFGATDENDVEKELAEELKELEKAKKLGKKTRKALTRRERNLIYESDSEHPYSSSSEDDTSDEEKQKEIDRRKDEEAKNKAKAEAKLPSGASSKGTNTPSGAPGRPKTTEPLKKPKNNLKRSGSPNLSESSGNESSRKKHKKKHLGSSHPSGTSTPIPGSRPMSPAPNSQSAPGQAPRKSSVVKLNVNPSKLSEIQAAPPNPSPSFGAMSDGEATGGEMSEGGSVKAGGSRAGSPATQEPSMQSTPRSSFLYLSGFFIGTTFQYGFTEKWLIKRKLEEVFFRTNTTYHVAMKLAVRTLPQWAAGIMSYQDWLLYQMRSTTSTDATRARSPVNGPIQPHEIVAALPDSGIFIANLMKVFAGRVGENEGQTPKKEFIRLVKENSTYGPDKLLRRK
ncbi:hypothetical protein G7Y89_g14282 [Cudoniella acicularis]|uniref:Transcription initiation factor IIF subunit alpha n=1 Tax=Cudoniella acicularis TaxID=354080 RepID=A0A8H4R3H2_9HELO|nr:hypothetical protein G7Y89_g14282 [Cudoniella acicularis]